VKKTLLTLAGALLLLAVILLVKDWRDKDAAKPRYVFDAAYEDVARLTIAYQQDSVTLIRLGRLGARLGGDGGHAGRWVNAADSFPADTARLMRVLDRVLTLQNRERAARSPDSALLAEYGLNDAEAKRISWTGADGTRHTVLVGKTSGTDFGSTYWKFADKEEVYLTPGSFTHDIPARPHDWKDKNLFPFFVYEDVQSVEVEWMDPTGSRVHYKLERGTGDTAYMMTAPLRAVVPAANAVKVYEQTPQFVIDEFVDPLDPRLPFAGLDDRVLTVRTVMKDGTVRELLAGHDLDGMHFARHPFVKRSIIRIAAWRVNFFKKTPEQLLTPPPADSIVNAPEMPDVQMHSPDDGHGH
jgi:hypothetical protein